MIKNFVYKLKDALNEALPGKEFQYRMAPSGRIPEGSFAKQQEAGVLLCLYPDGHGYKTIFIKRSSYNGHHSGQVSLPGGKKDYNDQDLIQTALREAQEEVNLKQVNVLGTLTPLFIPVSGFEVLPVIGFIDRKPRLIPEPGEVEYIIMASLPELFSESNRQWKYLEIQGESRHIPYYKVEQEHIWGATAMILSEFEEVLRRHQLMNI